MDRIAAKPGLYDPASLVPQLNGTRCSDCGATFFPPLQTGCEKCGSTGLTPLKIEAVGKLHSVVTVHMHMGKDIEAPFTVAEVALDNGPIIRAMLAEPADLNAIGKRVSALWETTKTDEDGNEVVEPYFTLSAKGNV